MTTATIAPVRQRPYLSAVFQARQLTKVYQMGEVEVHALRGVDLDLYQGEFVVLLGPFGERQVHAAQHSWWARRADQRQRVLPGS